MMLPMAPRLDGGGERQATRTDFAGLEQPHALFAAAAVPEPPAEAPRGEETEQLVTNFAVGRVIVTCAPESAHFDHCFNSKCRGQGSVRCSKCERSSSGPREVIRVRFDVSGSRRVAVGEASTLRERVEG